MAKTPAERQAEYRLKTLTRSHHFGHLNDFRCRQLLKTSSIVADDRVEAKAIVDYFMAMPLCNMLPNRLEGEKSLMVFLNKGFNGYEASSALLALQAITSREINIFWDGTADHESWPKDCWPMEHYDYVKFIEAELKEAGLWRTCLPREPYPSPYEVR